MLYGFGIREQAIVWGSNAALAYGFIASAYILKKQSIHFKLEINRKLLKDAINYGLRGQVGQILQFINYRFDLLVVNALLGTASVGIYGVGAAVSQIIWQVPNALSYALYSRVSAVEREDGNRITERVARQSLMLSLLLALFMMPVGYLAIPLLFGKSFAPAVMSMYLLLPGVVLLSHYKILGVHMAGQGHPEYYSYAAGVSAVVTLILDFVLVPRMGINGAAVASSVAYTLTSALSVYWFCRMTGMKSVSRLFLPQRGDLIRRGKHVKREK
jgi:O-antigen/teichoic acid export membrane protein